MGPCRKSNTLNCLPLILLISVKAKAASSCLPATGPSTLTTSEKSRLAKCLSPGQCLGEITWLASMTLHRSVKESLSKKRTAADRMAAYRLVTVRVWPYGLVRRPRRTVNPIIARPLRSAPSLAVTANTLAEKCFLICSTDRTISVVRPAGQDRAITMAPVQGLFVFFGSSMKSPPDTA